MSYPVENKKNVTVTLQSKELVYGIMNKTHVTARSLESAGKITPESAASIQANGDEENSYEMWRAVTTAIGETKVELAEFLSTSDDDVTVDNMVLSDVEGGAPITLEFNLPSNADTGSADALGAGINDFIVGRAIYNWYRLTIPELAAACSADAEAILTRIKKSLYKRSRPERPEYN